MWAQAARDRDALEAELGLRHKEERDILLQEAAERADEMIKEVILQYGGGGMNSMLTYYYLINLRTARWNPDWDMGSFDFVAGAIYIGFNF